MIKNILVAAVAVSLLSASCGKSRAVYARSNTVEPNADLAGSKGGPGIGDGALTGIGGKDSLSGGPKDIVGSLDGEVGSNGINNGPGGTPVNHGIDPVYFAFDSAAVAPAEEHKIQEIAKLLVDNPAYVCVVKGHCDERGSEEYNRALGERRAIAVKDILVQIRPDLESRVTTQSMGEEVAQQGGGSEAVWSKDRKGEFEVLDQSKK